MNQQNTDVERSAGRVEGGGSADDQGLARPRGSRPLHHVPYRRYSSASIRSHESLRGDGARSADARARVATAPQLLVASMGTRSSGGFTIAIDGLTLAGDVLLVDVSEQTSGRNCAVTRAITKPVALARLERSDLPVRFRRSQEVRELRVIRS